MSPFHAAILGLIQGLTEFLPVSSSGHLVLGEALLGATAVDGSLFFEIWVHAATLGAVICLYWRDLVNVLFEMAGQKAPLADLRAATPEEGTIPLVSGWRLALFLILGTIPAAVIGLLFKDNIEEVFDSPKIVGGMLIVTSLVLFASRWEPTTRKPLTFAAALIIGICQAFAILPGISRSGSTIVAGLFLGLPRREAVRFAFLLSIPAIGGALVLMLAKEGIPSSFSVAVLAVSFVAAFVSGLFAIRAVQWLTAKGKLYAFAPYCLVAGLLAILFL